MSYPSGLRPSTIEPRMQPARIAELLAPFLNPPVRCHSEPPRSGGEELAASTRVDLAPNTHSLTVLSTEQLNRISTYIDLLLRWNARINLTAIRNEEEIVTRHFGESLFVARHLFPQGAATALDCAERSSAMSIGREQYRASPALQGRESNNQETGASVSEGCANDQQRATNNYPTLADLGSGAGFPGIPIKLWAPDISLTLIESNHKKAAFLREVARTLTLTHIDIQNRRADATAPHKIYDVVTFRAVERFEDILPTAASLVAPQGRLALLIGSAQASKVTHSLSLTWLSPMPVPQSTSRMLLVGMNRKS